jgi:hypothetical protein
MLTKAVVLGPPTTLVRRDTWDRRQGELVGIARVTALHRTARDEFRLTSGTTNNQRFPRR